MKIRRQISDQIKDRMSKSDKADLLWETGTSYLYKDVLDLSGIKYSQKLRDLLKLLAFRVGNEVSVLELSNSLGINRETVEKYLACTGRRPSVYFWRTYTGAELDYIEEGDGKLAGYEIKYGKTRHKAPQTWLETYKNATFQLVNKENYMNFLI